MENSPNRQFPPKRMTLLVSKLSGRGKARLQGQRVANLLREGGWIVDLYQMGIQDSPAGLVELTSDPYIGAVGGDGYLATVARAVAQHPGKTLVPFPAGSGNDLCRALGVGTSAIRWAKKLADLTDRQLSERTALMDGMVVRAGDREAEKLTWGIVSLGIDATANLIANESRHFRGSLSYTWGALQAFLQQQHVTTRGWVNGEEQDLTGWIASVSNTGWMGGGINLVPSSALDDGQLELFNVGPTSKPRAIPLLARVLAHRKPRSSLVRLCTGTEFRLECEDPTPVMADGDLVGHTPVTVRVAPRALSVLR